MTKIQARALLRSRIEKELRQASDTKRVTVEWFIENGWKPLREGTWRGNTAAANQYFFPHIIQRFGSDAVEDLDAVELQVCLNELAKNYSTLWSGTSGCT